MIGIQCNKRDATIEWTPTGYNQVPILTYKIQYNTSFNPDSWDVAFDSVPFTDTRFNFAMSPWTNYTFRVIARNKIGKLLSIIIKLMINLIVIKLKMIINRRKLMKMMIEMECIFEL